MPIYKSNGKHYVIDDADVNDFLSAYPNAEELDSLPSNLQEARKKRGESTIGTTQSETVPQKSETPTTESKVDMSSANMGGASPKQESVRPKVPYSPIQRREPTQEEKTEAFFRDLRSNNPLGYMTEPFMYSPKNEPRNEEKQDYSSLAPTTSQLPDAKLDPYMRGVEGAIYVPESDEDAKEFAEGVQKRHLLGEIDKLKKKRDTPESLDYTKRYGLPDRAVAPKNIFSREDKIELARLQKEYYATLTDRERVLMEMNDLAQEIKSDRGAYHAKKQLEEKKKEYETLFAEEIAENKRLAREKTKEVSEWAVPLAQNAMNNASRSAGGDYTMGVPYSVSFNIALLGNDEYNQAKRVLSNLEVAQELIANADRIAAGQGFLGGAWHGLKDNIADRKTWENLIDPINAVRSEYDISDVYKKYQEKGEGGLTDLEKAVLDSEAMRIAVEQHIGSGDWTNGYSVGQGVSGSIPFMVEMAISASMGGAPSAVKGVSLGVLKRYAQRYGTKAALGQFAKKTAVGTGKGFAYGAGQTATIGLPGLLKGAEERNRGDVKIDDQMNFAGISAGDAYGTALAKEFISGTIERGVEMAPGIEEVNNLFGLGAKYAPKSVREAIERTSGSQWAQNIDDFMGKTQWHGVVGEYFEEVETGLLNMALVGDEEWDKFWTVDNQMNLFLTTAMIGGSTSALKTFGYRSEETVARDKADALNRAMHNVMGAEWDAMEQDLRDPERAAQVLADMRVSGYDVNSLRMAMEYARLRAKQMGAELAEQKLAETNPTVAAAHEAYNNGRTAEDVDTQAQVATALAEAEQALSPEQREALSGDDFVSVAESMINEGADATALNNYVQARAANEGMRDHVREQASAEADANDAKVDAVTNPQTGTTQQATTKNGEAVHVVGGELTTNEDGTVNTAASSESVVIVHEDGTKEMVAPTEITSASQAVSAEEQKAQARADIEAAHQSAVDNQVAQNQQVAQVNEAAATNGTATLYAEDGSLVDGVQLAPGKQEGMVAVRGAEAIFGSNALEVPATEVASRVQSITPGGTETEAPAPQAPTQEQSAPTSPAYEIGQEVEFADGTRALITDISADGYEVETDRSINNKYVNTISAEEFAERMGVQQAQAQTQSQAPFSVGNAVALTDGSTGVIAMDTGDSYVVEANGRAIQIPYADAQTSMRHAPQTQNVTESNELQNESNETQNESNETQNESVEANVSSLSQMPKTEQGEVDYANADTALATQAWLEENEGDAQVASELANEVAEEKRKEAEALAQTAPQTAGLSPSEKAKAMREHKAKVAQAQTEAQQWANIASALQGGNAQASASTSSQAAPTSQEQAMQEQATQEQAEFSQWAAQVYDVATRMAERWGRLLNVNVQVHTDVSTIANREATERIASGDVVDGWYEPSTNEVHVFVPGVVQRGLMDGVYPIDRLGQTIRHEAVAHRGLRETLGDNYDSYMESVWERMNEEERAQWIAYVGGDANNASSRIAAADEYCASVAEANEPSTREMSTFESLVKSVGDFFKSIFGNIPAKTLEQEVRDVLRANYAYMRAEGAEARAEVRAKVQDMLKREKQKRAKNSTKVEESSAEPRSGAFGTIYTQFKGKSKEAIAFLLEKKEGEAVAALHHPEIGDIDLVWGKEGTGKSDGFGLAKLAKYHPEVLDNLQEILNDMRVTARSANRVQLESDTHQAAVRLTWDNENKNWLLTAFEKKNSVSDNTTDTGETSNGGKRNDTATPQNTVSDSKGTDNLSEKQKSGEENVVAEATDVLRSQGANVDEQRGDVRFSVAYTPKGEAKEKFIADVMAVTERSRADVERYLKAEESLTAFIYNEQNAPFLDYRADDRYTAIKENSDYPQGTVDFNNICRKRASFTTIYDRLQREFPMHVFTGNDLAKIREVMKKNGMEVACGLCYVEDRRQLMGEIAESFIEELKGGFKAYASKSPAKAKVAEKIKNQIGEDTYIPDIADLITLAGSTELHKSHPKIYEAFNIFNNARGQQSANLFQGYAEYKREILKWSDAKVKKANDNGGLRIFSYSDFEAHHLIDIVQIINDCAARGVKIQGYTKVPAVAKVLANTNVKLNRSLIPLGDTGIKDGKLAYDPIEGIDINDKDFFESNDNVGNVLVGCNDEQIRMAMLDDFVHYIIPFHTNQKQELVEAKGCGKWTNYKYEQREYKDGKAAEKGVNIYTDVLNAAEKEGNPITNEREFTERFLNVCKERGLTPRFARFLNTDANGEYTYTPGYYKLLLDFKMFDANGNILPQNPIEANFDNQLNQEILEDYVKGETAKLEEGHDAKMDKVFAEVKSALGLTPMFSAKKGTNESPAEMLERMGSEAEKESAQTDDIRFSFIGEKGAEALDRAEEATTRLDNLNVARDMEAQGKDALAIKMATGWERGADGKWRYETEDVKLKVDFWKKKDVTLGDVADLGELGKAYPDLKDIKVVIDTKESDANGSYSHKKNTITLYINGANNTRKIAGAISRNIPFTKFIADYMTSSAKESVDRTLVHEIQHAIQHREGFAKGGNKRMRIGESEERLGYEGYRKLAGEVEARNVSERMDKTMDERRASLRTETQDVADKDQIFINDALESASDEKVATASQLTETVGDDAILEEGAATMSQRSGQTMFSFAKSPEEFDAVQREAVRQKGIVAPNLNNIVLDIVDIDRHDFAGTGKEAIETAKEWANKNIVGEHTAKAGTSEEFAYTIDEKSIKKYLSSIATQKSDNLGVHLSVLKRLPYVINNSVEAEIHADYKKIDGRDSANGINDYNLLIHRLYGCARINNELHRVKTTLKEKKSDGIKPYSYEVTKIELLSGSSQNGTSSSDALNNSIDGAKLLENVEKSYDPGVKLLDASEKTREGDGQDVTRFSSRPIIGDKKLFEGLRELGEGEMSAVERVFTESKSFEFTSKNKIESYDDVAYIFKQLENESVENTFVVLVKKGKPTVVHLAMGHFTQSFVNRSAIHAAVTRVQPDKIYFVHNHPSGVLKSSPQDRAILNQLYRTYGEKVQDGIIINTYSGEYGVFDIMYDDSRRMPQQIEGERPIKVYSFSKQVYNNDFRPTSKMDTAEAIAGFITSHRLGDREKLGLIVLNNGLGIVGNVFLPYTEVTSDNVKSVGKDIAYHAVVMGGTRAILYGNGALESIADKGLSEAVRESTEGEIQLLDYLHIEGGNAMSASSEGVRFSVAPNASPVERLRSASAPMLDDVANRGLKDMFGKNYDTFVQEVYQDLPVAERKKIADAAAKIGWDFPRATEEYLARFANDEVFSNTDPEVWQQIRDRFNEMISEGEYSRNVLNNNNLRYALWRNAENATEKVTDGPLALASDVATHNRLEESDAEPGVRFSVASPADVRAVYDRRISSGAFQSREALQDSMLALKDAMKMISGKKRIEDIADFENAYMGENRLSSVNKEEIELFQKLAIEPMIAEATKLAPTDKEFYELVDYMMAKHGLERNAYMRAQAIANGENGNRDFAGLTALTGKKDVTDAEIKAEIMVKAYEVVNDTKDLWKRVNDVNRSILQKQLDSGMISKETFDQISNMYEYYIPLRGHDETTAEEMYAYMGQQGSGFAKPIKNAKGRSSKADNPFVYMQMMADSAITQSNRNVLVKQRFLNFVLNNPSNLVSVSDLWLQKDANGNWVAVFPDTIDEDDPPHVVETKMKAWEQQMEQNAQNAPAHYKKGTQRAKIPFKVEEQRNKGQHHVIVMRNGKPVVITVNGNPRLAFAVNGLTNPDNKASGAVSALFEFGENINRRLSAAYTSLNPNFIMSNYMRDIMYTSLSVWAKESPKYAAKFDANVAIMNPAHMRMLYYKYANGKLDMNNKTERLFAEFMKNGGETGYAALRNIDQHRKDIKETIKRSRGITMKQGWDFLWERLDNANRSIENCARFAAYVTSRSEGRSIGRSIYDAKEISVNFNKKGAGARFMGAKGQTRAGNAAAFTAGLGKALYAFWNPAIQGMVNYGRNYTKNPWIATGQAFALFAIGAAMAYFADDDDDEEGKGTSYYDLPEGVRRSNIVIPIGGGNYITWALPIEFRSIYGLGELVGSVWSGKADKTDEEIRKEVFQQISGLLPLDVIGEGGDAFVPTWMKPVWEVYNNEGYSGLPIYKDSEYNEHRPGWTKAYKSTLPWLVDATKILNEMGGGNAHKSGGFWYDWNPAAIEHLLRGYLGGLYQAPRQLYNSAQVVFGDRKFNPSETMIVNRFWKQGDERTQNRALNNRFFGTANKINTLNKQFNGYVKDTKSGKEDFTTEVKEMMENGDVTRIEIYKKYKKVIDALSFEINTTQDESTIAELEQERMQKKRDFLKTMEEIDKKYQAESGTQSQGK